MNTPNKPMSEWTLRELKDWCGNFSCDVCPAPGYRKEGFCQFWDGNPRSWEFPDGEKQRVGGFDSTPNPSLSEKGGELSGGGSIAEKGGETKTVKPAKPRLAEILGVEVGEEFAIKIFGKEVSGFSVHEDGILWQGDRSSLTAECLALIINYPDQIVRLPRLTEPELAICKTLGAKWVTRDKENYVEEGHVLLWKEKPELAEGIYGRCETGMVGMILDESGLFTKSVRPGECIAVEEASEIV